MDKKLKYPVSMLFGFTALMSTAMASRAMLIEAEDYTGNQISGTHGWSEANAGSAMQLLPDIGVRLGTAADVNTTTDARLDYAIDFPAAGTYYVSLLANGPEDDTSGGSDSVHVGLNGAITAEKFETPGNFSSWHNIDGTGDRAIITVPSAGTHTFNIFMREDGTIVDKIFLSQDVNEAPPAIEQPPVPGEVELINDPLDGSTIGTVVGSVAFQTGGGIRSTGGKIVFDAGQQITNGYFEATMRGYTVPQTGTPKSHPLSGWEFNTGNNDFNQKAPRVGSFWNWRIGTNYDVLKTLAASDSITTRHEARAGSADQINGKTHVARIEWNAGLITFKIDGAVIWSYQFDRMSLRYFTIGRDDSYTRLTNDPPIISNVRVVDASATGSADTTPPSIPAGLSADAPTETVVDLTWNESTDGEGSVDSYRIYRDSVPVATASSTAYSDTGLTAGTNYIYSVSAIDDSGNESSVSSTVSVTTPGGAVDETPPGVPQSVTASNVTVSGVDLAWQASVDPEGSAVSYEIYRGQTFLATVTGLNYTDTNVSAGATYDYTVVALDAEGNASNPSAATTVTIPSAADTTAPGAPTNLQGTAPSDTQVSLSWGAATDNVGVVGYRVYRDGEASPIADVTTTSYVDTGLTAVTAYLYAVSAYDAAGNESAQTSAVSVTTQDAPQPGSGQLIEAENYTSLNDGNPHAWELTADGTAMVVLPDYRVRLGTAADVDASTARMDYAVNFEAAGVYYVSVMGYGPDTTGTSDSVHVGLNGTVTAEKMELTSTVPTWFDVVGTGERAIITVPSAGIHTVNIFMREDGTIVDKFFLSQDPNADPAGATGSGDTTAPSVPLNLIGVSLSSDGASLTWDAATDSEGDVVSYRVFRDGVAITTVTDPAYDDTGLAGDTTYTYTVTAIDDAANESAQSAPYMVTTASATDTAPPTVPENLSATVTGPSTVDLSWDVATDGEGSIVNYRIYRDDSLITTVAETSYSDTGLSAATEYTYTVTAIDENINESAPSAAALVTTEAVADIAPPTVPANLQGVADSDSAITLSWDAASDAESGVVSYHVYRDGSEIAEVAQTSYTDTGLLAETDYVYSVSAEDAAGNESAASSTVTVATAAAPEPGTGTLLEAENYTSLNAGDPHAWELTSDGLGMEVLPDIGVRLGTAASVDETTARMDYAVNFDAAGVYYVSINGYGSLTANIGTSDSVHVGLNGTVTAEKIELLGSDTGWYNETGSGERATITVPSAGVHTLNIFMREDGSIVDKIFLSQDQNADPDGATGSNDSTPPDAPQNLTGAAQSSSDISLSWDTAQDTGGVVVSYRVYRDALAIATINDTVYTDTGLSGDTLYTYTVTAIDDSGNESDLSVELAVTTLAAADTNPPGIPENVSATASSPTTVDLVWDASTDAEGSTVSYSVYRDGAFLATVTTTAYSDSGVSADSTYAYTVTALDESNNESDPSIEATVTTPSAADTNPPSIPQNLAAANVTVTSVDLSWDIATDPEGGAITYLILRDSAEVGSTAATSYTDTGLTGATSYDYSIVAEDAAGNASAASAVVTVTTDPAPDTDAPSVPENVAGTGDSDSTISLTWDASEDFDGAVSGYRIYRDLQEPFIAEVTTTGYIDNGLSASTAYDYEVSAFDDSGNESGKSVAISVSTQAPPADITPPTVPLNVIAIAMSSSSVDVSWDASSDAESGLQSYRVFRGGVEVALVATNSYSDSALDPDTTYSYTVTAIDVAGNESDPSAAASATTLVEQDLTPPGVPANLTVTSDTPNTATLAWDASNDEGGGSVSAYRVYRDDSFVIEVVSTGFIDNNLTEGTQYSYAVSAVDDSGNESAQSTAVDVTTQAADTAPPSVPLGLTATPTSTTSISLMWNASTDDDGAVAGYDVFRDGVQQATVTTPEYSDSGLEPDTTYSYTVRAFDDSLNESQQSTAVTATTDAETGGFTEVNIDFSSGDTSAWSFVYDSGPNQPINWLIENGVLKQTGYVTKRQGTTYDGSYRFGTYASLNGYSDLTDYRFEVDIIPRRDGIDRAPYDSSDQGIMFRYTDSDNYYRLSVNTRKSFTRLEKRVGGVFEPLANSEQGYTEDQTMQLAVVVSGPIIRVERDGEALFTVYDEDLPAGSVALYSQDSVEFDNVAITNIPSTPIVTAGFPSDFSVTPGTSVQATASVINAPPGSYVEFDFAAAACATAVETPAGSGFYTADCGTYAAGSYDTPTTALGVFLYSAADLLLESDYNVVVGLGGIEYIIAGDSITEGSFDLYEPDNITTDGRMIGRQGYAAPLAEMLATATGDPAVIHNEAVGGDNSGGVNNRIRSAMDRHPNSTRVLLMAGTNDAASSTPRTVDYFTGNMQSVADRVNARGMEPWIALMPPALPYASFTTSNASRALYNAAIPGLTGTVTGPDFWSFFYDDKGTSDTSDDYERYSLFFDNLHPNALGQRIMATMWYNSLTGGNEQPFYLDLLCNRLESPACDAVSPTTHKQDLLWTAYPVIYADEYYEVTSTPAYLADGIWIKTNDAEADATEAAYIDFEVDRPVQVYVAYDAGATSVPDWLASGFSDTGDIIDTDHPLAPQMTVWEATMSAGSVSLGANMATGAIGADANYVVIVQPQ